MVANASTTEEKAISHPKRLIWWTAATLILAFAIIGFDRFARASDMIAVIPARWNWTDPELSPLDEKLAETIAAQLANRTSARVVSWPAVSEAHRALGATHSDGALAKQVRASRLLMVAVRGEGSARVTVFLVDSVSNRKFWVNEYQQTGLMSLQNRRELAQRIAQDFVDKTAPK